MMRNRYAGPLPDRPVTASSCDSSRTTVSPTESKMVRAVARSASVACSPRARAVAAAATVAGVLGIALTMRIGGCRRRSIAAMGTPAATLTISLSRETSAEMPRRTWSRICGLTASTTTSLSLATSELEPPRTP